MRRRTRAMITPTQPHTIETKHGGNQTNSHMHARMYPAMVCRAPNDVAQGSDAESCDLQRQPIPTENGRICC